MRNDLKPLYEPESVAVIGASSKPGKPGNDVIRNIMANQYPGRLYLVNPKAEQIEGLPVWPSIDALPEAVDQAILILPAQANPAAIKACAEKGVKSLVLAAGGFAEVDQAGEALQAEITRAIRAAGIRAIGPNTSGHISMPANYTSSFFPLGPIRKGAVSFITQTGNFATHTMRYMLSAEHIGVARVTGLGNKVDLDECDVLEYYADDPATEAIVAYLENLKRPRRFIEIASEVTKTKPMVMLKGGATQEGAAAAMAHTAALASDDRILDGALRQAGITRVYKYSHLILAAKAFSYKPWPLGNRVSFLAPSGAMLVCLTDLCRRFWGLEVPEVEEPTRARLQEISPPFLKMRNPVDIWGAATLHNVEYGYREGMEAVLADPNIDTVIPVLLLTEETGLPDYDFIPRLAEKWPEKSIMVTFTGDKKHMDAAKQYLEPRGIPCYQYIEEPFEALEILVRCRKSMQR